MVRSDVTAPAIDFAHIDVLLAEVVALETAVHSGRVRVKFVLPNRGELRGWASVRSGSGGEVLRPCHTERTATADSSAEWDDEAERCKSWLLMQGATADVAGRVLSDQSDRNATPSEWLPALTACSSDALHDMLQATEKKLAEEERLAGVMIHAGQLLCEGKYDGALMQYSQVLSMDPDHDEARRGKAEAEKGRRFASLTEKR